MFKLESCPTGKYAPPPGIWNATLSNCNPTYTVAPACSVWLNHYTSKISQLWATVSPLLSPTNLNIEYSPNCNHVTSINNGSKWPMHIHSLMSQGSSFDPRVILTTSLLRKFHLTETISYQLTNWPFLFFFWVSNFYFLFKPCACEMKNKACVQSPLHI